MILVTGGAGFIGRNLVLRLIADGEKVVAVDRRPLSDFEPLDSPAYAMESCDLSQTEVLEDLLARHRPRVVIALADVLTGDLAQMVGDGAALLNATLKAARAAAVQRICLASSIIVYQGLEGPFREDMPLPVESGLHISALKKAEEIIGQWFGANSSLEVTALRFANIYGPRYRSMMNTPSRYLYQALGRPVPTDGLALDGAFYERLSDFCHVDDLCQGVSLAARAPTLRHTAYNIGSGVGTTDAQIRNAAARAAGHNAAAADPTGNPNYLDISRIRDELGYRPQYDIDDGLAAYRRWLEDDDKGARA